MLSACVCTAAVSSLGQGLVHTMGSIRDSQPCLWSIFKLFCSGIPQFREVSACAWSSCCFEWDTSFVFPDHKPSPDICTCWPHCSWLQDLGMHRFILWLREFYFMYNSFQCRFEGLHIRLLQLVNHVGISKIFLSFQAGNLSVSPKVSSYFSLVASIINKDPSVILI